MHIPVSLPCPSPVVVLAVPGCAHGLQGLDVLFGQFRCDGSGCNKMCVRDRDRKDFLGAVSCKHRPDDQYGFCGPCVGKLLRRRKAELPVAAPSSAAETYEGSSQPISVHPPNEVPLGSSKHANEY